MNENKKILKIAAEELEKNICADENNKAWVVNIKNDKINIKLRDNKFNFKQEIKNNINNTVINYFKTQNLNELNKKILITKYVNPVQAEKLQNKNIQFMDTAGNAYINKLPLYIYIKGNRPKKDMDFKKKNVFTKKGMRVIFTFLCEEELVNAPYRDIANRADVALGTVTYIMKNLINTGYVVKVKNKRRLIKREELFEKWVTRYPEILKPGLLLGRFAGINKWNEINYLDPKNAQWGGEPAAAEKTGYLKPQVVTVYMNKNKLDDIVLRNRLKKDPEGNIEIYERFWKVAQGEKKKKVVPPLLIYADLLAEDNERTTETANIIYEKYLRHFKED